jgi:hypothetical protein
MKRKIFGSLLILIIISTLGCNDDQFLQEKPSTFYTLDNVFTTSAQVDQALIAVYSHHRDMLANPSESNNNYLWKSNGTDLLDLNINGVGTSMCNYSVFIPSHPAISGLYDSFYKLINKSNLVIRTANLPQITWSSASAKSYVIAQARFFRAFAYCNLAELWGGVPIVTEVYDQPRYDFKRESRTAVYQFAIDELLAIENDLPVTSTVGGRIVRGAAQHFLTELYLALGIQLAADGKATEAQTAYTNSINYGNKVIDGGTYNLMNSRFGSRLSESTVVINCYKNGVFATSSIVDTVQFKPNFYWDLFQEGNVNYQEGNKECVWAIQIDYAAYKAEDKNSKLPYTRAYGPAIRDGSSGFLTGMLEDAGGRGVTAQVPTFYMKEYVWADKWGKDIRNSEIVIRKRFKGNVPAKEWYLKVIPWDVLYNTPENKGRCYPVSCKISTDRFTGVADGENRSNLFRDDYAIRLPETILLRAEAKQRKGDKAGAAADVNLIRTRAKSSYLVTPADMDDNFDLILDERARELSYEEHRWNTLLRMGGTVAVDRIKKYMMWDQLKSTLTRNFNLFPIPQTVIDVNIGNKIEQNPGWN